MKKASIIIIVKNDPGIRKTIDHLLKHKSKIQFEIIAVVKLKKHETMDYIDSRVNLVPYHNELRTITIPQQRNLGVKKAAYDPIVFIDASCVPATGWLDGLYAQFESGEHIVAGYVRSDDEHVVNNISGSIKKSSYLEECPTANVLISKKVFDDLGGFDETFEYGSDVDFMWRARDLGYQIKFEPKAIVSHDWGDIYEQFRRAFRYGRARVQLYYKHTKRWKYFLKKDALLFFYALFILFSPLGLFFPPYFLVLLLPVVKNWNAKPLKQTALNLAFGLGVLQKNFELLSKRLSV